jgi:hypothetical protein
VHEEDVVSQVTQRDRVAGRERIVCAEDDSRALPPDLRGEQPFEILAPTEEGGVETPFADGSSTLTTARSG